MQSGVVPLVGGHVASRHELDAAKDAIRKQAGPRRQAARVVHQGVGVAAGTMCFGSCQARIQSTVIVWGRFFFSSRSGSLESS